MVDHSHQPEGEEHPDKEAGFLSWEEVQRQVDEKFAKYGLTREEVERIDAALENNEEPDVTPEKLQAHREMNEASDQELKDTIDGLLDSLRPRIELPKWQIENVYSAWTGDMAKTLGRGFTKSLPEFFQDPGILGPSLLHGYLKEAGLFRDLFPLGTMPWLKNSPLLVKNMFSGFDFSQLTSVVSNPQVEEELDELIEENEDVRDFAEGSATEVEKSAGVSRPVAMRLSVIAIFILHTGLALYVITGLPLHELVQLLIASLAARGDSKEVIDYFNKQDDE